MKKKTAFITSAIGLAILYFIEDKKLISNDINIWYKFAVGFCVMLAVFLIGELIERLFRSKKNN